MISKSERFLSGGTLPLCGMVRCTVGDQGGRGEGCVCVWAFNHGACVFAPGSMQSCFV